MHLLKISDQQMKTSDKVTVKFNGDKDSSTAQKPLITIPLEQNDTFKNKKFLHV